MKYATLLLGLAILMASVATARACDHATFICKPGSIKVVVSYRTDNPDCKASFSMNGKTFPYPSRLFRLKGDVLYYRGRRCVEAPE